MKKIEFEEEKKPEDVDNKDYWQYAHNTESRTPAAGVLEIAPAHENINAKALGVKWRTEYGEPLGILDFSPKPHGATTDYPYPEVRNLFIKIKDKLKQE